MFSLTGRFMNQPPSFVFHSLPAPPMSADAVLAAGTEGRGGPMTPQTTGRPCLLRERPAVPVVSRWTPFAPGRDRDKFPGGRC